MGNLAEFAKQELDRIGMTDDDVTGEDMNFHMRDHILRMVEEFEKEDHSGFSANYALSILKKLLAFKPLSPLTGDDDEWQHVYDNDLGEPVYQNRRLSTIFKSKSEGAYDIDGKVFWEWFTDDDGTKHKVHFTSRDSRVPVEFPYTPPDNPIYEYRPSEDDEYDELADTTTNTIQEVKAAE